MSKYLSDMSRQKKKKIREELSSIHGWKCFYCGRDLIPDGGYGKFLDPDSSSYVIPDGFYVPVLDHKIPRVRGGKNEVDNLVLACSECNGKKNDKTVDEYMRRLS